MTFRLEPSHFGNLRACSEGHYYLSFESPGNGRTMSQAVSRRPLTAEALVRSQVSPYEICGGQSVTGTVFPPEYFGFPLDYK